MTRQDVAPRIDYRGSAPTKSGCSKVGRRAEPRRTEAGSRCNLRIGAFESDRCSSECGARRRPPSSVCEGPKTPTGTRPSASASETKGEATYLRTVPSHCVDQPPHPGGSGTTLTEDLAAERGRGRRPWWSGHARQGLLAPRRGLAGRAPRDPAHGVRLHGGVPARARRDPRRAGGDDARLAPRRAPRAAPGRAGRRGREGGRSGRVVTAEGVTAGLDLGLHLVERFYGAKLAARVTEVMEHPAPRWGWRGLGFCSPAAAGCRQGSAPPCRL